MDLEQIEELKQRKTGLKVPEVAHILGITPYAVRKLVRAGEIPTIPHGLPRAVSFSPTVLARWMEDQHSECLAFCKIGDQDAGGLPTKFSLPYPTDKETDDVLGYWDLLRREQNIIPERKRKSYVEWVYFLQAETEARTIKIGRSGIVNLHGRVKALLGSSPVPLRLLLLKAGPKGFEKFLHWRFAAYRDRYEWFHPAPIVLACINDRRWELGLEPVERG